MINIILTLSNHVLDPVFTPVASEIAKTVVYGKMSVCFTSTSIYGCITSANATESSKIDILLCIGLMVVYLIAIGVITVVTAVIYDRAFLAGGAFTVYERAGDSVIVLCRSDNVFGVCNKNSAYAYGDCVVVGVQAIFKISYRVIRAIVAETAS